MIPGPAYADYATACRRAGLDVVSLALLPQTDFALDPADLDAVLASAPALVVLGSPGNPTGRVIPAATIRALAGRHPDSLFVVDEALPISRTTLSAWPARTAPKTWSCSSR